ncbi:MAG TPA: DUF4340 domain-containing protein [Anaeromyxobacteraceae bacterium]|nr:DUF4340 domain-containing protein [Anaeromyxobacteraceae bacterium]
MKARSRTAVLTLALLVAAAGALALAFYLVERPAQREKVTKEEEEKVLQVRRDQVRALRLSGKEPEVRLERAGGGWRVTAPVKAPADPVAADALLDSLLGLRRRQRVAEPDAGLGAFGLDPPRMRLWLELEGGETRELEVGEESSFDGSLFVRAAGGPVVSVGPGTRYALEKGLLDLREKQLFAVEEKDLTRLEVKRPKLALALVREGGEWWLAAPIAERADDSAVGRLVSALRSLRAARFDDAPGPDAGYGLDRPRWTVTARGPGETVRTLEVGAAPKAKGAAVKEAETAAAAELWARVSGSPSLAALPAGAARDLDLDLWALRDKALLRFEPDAVAVVRVERGGEALEARRAAPAPDGGLSREWALAAPKAGPAAAWKVSGLLYSLQSLKAARFADERGMRLAEHGLSPPAAVVTLLGPGGETLGRLEVGKPAGEETFVRGSASPRIAAVPTSGLSSIPKGPEDLAEPKAAGDRGQKDGGPRQGG